MFFAIFMTAAGGVYAAGISPSQQTEESLAVAITIDAENLIELYQSVPELKIIDSRLLQEHRRGYIETSVSLPLPETNCGSLRQLAPDKDDALVFYCNSGLADPSIEAIHIASSCGYKRLFWFRGGFVEWMDKDYPYLIE